MSEALSAVLARALELPANERGELIDRLADSLDPPDEFGELTADEFADELVRRASEMRTDPAAGVLWDDVKGMR